MNPSTVRCVCATLFSLVGLTNQIACAQLRNDFEAPSDSHDVAERKQVDESLSLVKAGRAQDAIDHLAPVLADYEQRYGNRQSYCARTVAESMSYMTQAAEKKVAAAIVSPAWCDALYIEAYALIELGQLERAENTLQSVIAMAPSRASYWSELGEAYSKQKNWPASLDAYERGEKAATDFSPEPVKKPGIVPSPARTGVRRR